MNELPLILPPRELIDILLPAFYPCPGIQGKCGGCVRWAPEKGYVPRGFRGATGRLDEVKLVLVLAEPGDPYEGEGYNGPAALDKLRFAYSYSCWHIQQPRDAFGWKIQEILKIAFPTLSLEEQLRRTWITESVLCSAPKECDVVSPEVEKECGGRYLRAQLRLFPNARIVALGRKAQKRLRGVSGVRRAFAAAPPGCYHPKAQESWVRALAGLEP